MTTPVTPTNSHIPSTDTERIEHALFVMKRIQNLALCETCLMANVYKFKSDVDLAVLILKGLSFSEDYILSRRGENHD